MTPRSSRFSPRLLDPEVLERLTVAREPLLARLIGNVSAAIASGQGRFDLLVGPRGAGKSHLLGLVEARIRAMEELRARVVVVSLPEEFHPSSLLHLLAKILQELPEEESLPPIEAQLRALRRQETSEATDMAVAMIRSRLAGRSLLLMLENLDVVFRDLGRKAQARLRKIIQTEPGWSIFATARTAIALAKQTEPFHGTFVVEQLEPLNPAQCREMMVRLARVHAQPELAVWLESDVALTHVRAAHHLVGGAPRVIAMLFHHLDPEDLDDFEGNFYRLAEEVTPYFQEQMARLSAGQRPVMEFLAERWAPASVTEIADGTFTAATTVSTHLRALRRDRLVRAIAVGRERYYEIAEPLHRIARAMKQDRKLGAAIAHMARVWALLSGGKGHTELAPDWVAEFCEGDSEYVERLVHELAPALDKRDPKVDGYIEEILRHSHGHPIQGTALFALLSLGRDERALAAAKAMVHFGLHEHVAIAYVISLEFSSIDVPCPLAQEFLDSILANSTEAIWKYLSGRDPDVRGEVLLRFSGRLGIRFAVDFLDTYQCEISDDGLLALALGAWLRLDFERIQTSKFTENLLTAAASRGRMSADAEMLLAILESCLALENSARKSDSTPHRFAHAVQWTQVCVPLWIASGRAMPPLRRALQEHAGTRDFPSEFGHVLIADDYVHAFARLGAEVRAFVRTFLNRVEASDLLARLPPEPTIDSP